MNGWGNDTLSATRTGTDGERNDYKVVQGVLKNISSSHLAACPDLGPDSGSSWKEEAARRSSGWLSLPDADAPPFAWACECPESGLLPYFSPGREGKGKNGAGRPEFLLGRKRACPVFRLGGSAMFTCVFRLRRDAFTMYGHTLICSETRPLTNPKCNKRCVCFYCSRVVSSCCWQILIAAPV